MEQLARHALIRSQSCSIFLDGMQNTESASGQRYHQRHNKGLTHEDQGVLAKIPGNPGCTGRSGRQCPAQFVGPGSTPQGDYLRGVGIAAMGMGIYNEKTAIAESINLDTTIRWNEYVAAVVKEQRREYVARREYLSAINKEMDKKIRDRLREHPEARDLLTGDALSDVMDQLTNPVISESSYRYAEVPLSVDVIRRIPFRLGESAQTFSMNRLTIKGKGKWPVAFQDKRFASELKFFEQAVDAALDEAIDGKRK